MTFNIREIVKAWITAANPSPEQVTLAEKRYAICSECVFFGIRDITKDKYCKSCGCPISKKVFSSNFDACPAHNWLEVESQHQSILSNKKELTTKDKNTLL